MFKNEFLRYDVRRLSISIIEKGCNFDTMCINKVNKEA